jgi:Zn-dependent peptidase ImmA (M78 family)/DNA-binding XRE family transcriptional regulator
MIGKRLKLARDGAGLSLRGLADRLDNAVSAQAIGKYERDEMMPGSKILIALSRELNVPVSYLVGSSKINLEGVEFRRNKITSKKEEHQVEAAVLNHLDRYLELEEILQVASTVWESPRGAPFQVHGLQDAEIATMTMRHHWDLGANPIPAFAEYLEERGIKVMALELPASVSGLTCRVVSEMGHRVPVIVVNANDTGERQRFTLAHELGHMVIEVDGAVDEEKAAHWFAGALLMPRDMLLSEVGRNRSSLGLGELFALKELFGVSVQAITYRCKDLDIVNGSTFRTLFETFKAKGWRTPPFPEPMPIPQETPKRFRRLCFRALAENAISESKAAELLGLSVHRLGREMEEAPST